MVVLLLLSFLCGEISAQTKYQTYSGRVFRISNSGNIHSASPHTTVRFIHVQSGINVTVRSNSSGIFSAKLAVNDYEIESMVPQTVIIMTSPNPDPRACDVYSSRIYGQPASPNRLSKQYSRPKRVNWKPRLSPAFQANPKGAPEVTIHSSVDTVRAGQTFKITVTARDNDGIDAIWWYASFSKDRNLSSKHIHKAKGRRNVKKVWDVTCDDIGLLVLAADASDIHYTDDFSKNAHKASLAHDIAEVKIVVIPPK